MFNDSMLDEIFRNRLEKIDELISKEYHKKIKLIKTNNREERENAKMGIISELYYKQGFIDGINFVIKSIKK